mgnify:CR=1 FL=1
MTIQKRLARSNIAMLAIPLITAAVLGVAIGELADGLDIYLDRVKTKYSGLNSTELAISESQERMAVVVAAEDADKLIKEAGPEVFVCSFYFLTAGCLSGRRTPGTW